MRKFRSLLLDTRGTETVEWGLIAGMIVGGLVLTIAAIGVWLNSRFEDLQDELAS